MITTIDHSKLESTFVREEIEKIEAQLGRVAVPVAGPLSSTYLPDEDDPAWPSKSGQAD